MMKPERLFKDAFQGADHTDLYSPVEREFADMTSAQRTRVMLFASVVGREWKRQGRVSEAREILRRLERHSSVDAMRRDLSGLLDIYEREAMI